MFTYKSFLQLDGASGSDVQSLSQNDYELTDFELSFQQGTDQKGQPSTNVVGAISMILPMLPTTEITQWALNSYIYKSGVIVSLDANDAPVSKIYFENAKCTHLSLKYSVGGKSYVSTSLIINVEELRYGNNVNFLNHWVK